MVEHLSKYAFVQPLNTKQSTECARAILSTIDSIETIFNQVPKNFKTDRGGEFMNDLADKLESRGIKHVRSHRSRNPQAQGAV
jgi:hypothetical protein